MYSPGYVEGDKADYDNVNVQVRKDEVILRCWLSLLLFRKCVKIWVSSFTTINSLSKSWERESSASSSLLRMVRSTRASGLLEHRFVKDAASRFGLMVQCTKVTGWTTKRTERADWSTLMEMCTTATGKMTKHMVMVSTAILTELATKATGRKISSTEMALKPGPTVPATTETTWKGAKTETGASLGPTRVPTTATSSRTTSKEKVRSSVPFRHDLNRIWNFGWSLEIRFAWSSQAFLNRIEPVKSNVILWY